MSEITGTLHKDRQQKWLQLLSSKGYKCKLEKRLYYSGIPHRWTVVDVFAENKDEILIVEIQIYHKIYRSGKGIIKCIKDDLGDQIKDREIRVIIDNARVRYFFDFECEDILCLQ